MKIFKVLCHGGVDFLLKNALTTSLTIYMSKDYPWGCDPSTKIECEKQASNLLKEYDIIIIDDLYTWGVITELGVTAKHYIWYIHGSYHIDYGFQNKWNAIFRNRQLNIWYPDEARRGYILQWLSSEVEILSELIMPPHLHPSSFYEVSTLRNGKCYVMGSRFMTVAAIYPGFKKVVEVIKRLMKYGPDKFHLYGYNDRKDRKLCGDRFIPDKFVKGFATDPRVIREYSASIHPSQVETVSFVLLESMARGVPVVTAKKLDLPDSFNGEAYAVCDTALGFISWSDFLMQSKSASVKMGIRGQDFLRSMYPFENYSSRINSWCSKILAS